MSSKWTERIIKIVMITLPISIGVNIYQFTHNRKQDRSFLYTQSRLKDVTERLDLYRDAVYQTELESLDAAEVFEKTDAFTYLVDSLCEDEQFTKVVTYHSMWY